MTKKYLTSLKSKDRDVRVTGVLFVHVKKEVKGQNNIKTNLDNYL